MFKTPKYSDSENAERRGWRHALRWDLATMGAVKYAPHGEIFGSVLELMLDPRSHEQEIAWLECISLAVVNEHASTTNYEVDLVLAMRRLLARAQRERKGYVKRATLQDHNGPLTRGSRDTCLRVGEMDDTATICFGHALFLLRHYRIPRRFWCAGFADRT